MSKKDNVLLLRYGELHLKGNNKKFFLNKLLLNLKEILSCYDLSISYNDTRFKISNYLPKDEDVLILKIKKIFGLKSLSKCVCCDNDIQLIKKYSSEFLKNKSINSFKIETNRANKKFPLTSIDVNKIVGEYILNTYKLKVDLLNPQIIINIDIREKTYIFIEKEECLGGLPLGTSGKGLSLLSGGIDSPVASFLMMRRGMKVDLLHFFSYPYTSLNAKQKVISIAKKLQEYDANIVLKMVNVAKIQETINEKCDKNLSIILLRCFMMRIAQQVACDNDCKVLITGESLAQVASQTTESIVVTNNVSTMPILRPLIGMDKEFIINFAKKIGTYELSIEPFHDCCTAFLPKHPIIKPNINKVSFQETKIKNSFDLIRRAIDNMEIVEIC